MAEDVRGAPGSNRPGSRADVRNAVTPGLSKVGPALVALQDVSKRFVQRKREILALEGVSFDVAPGEFVVIVGASGCGKSTLLKIVAGLVSPSAGTVRKASSVEGARGIGMAFQDPVLLPWRTVLKNVLLPTEVIRVEKARTRALELLRQVGLDGFEHAHPHQLSGGMQQRVAICRALLPDPPLLLMDEPFGALDAITREKLNLLLQRIWSETHKTVLFVTHSIEEAIFLADRIVVMTPRPGRITEIINDGLPRPRGVETFKSPLFAELAVHIRTLIVGPGGDLPDEAPAPA
jgi:NitT/TauT family transport system ATP-binding protein